MAILKSFFFLSIFVFTSHTLAADVQNLGFFVKLKDTRDRTVFLDQVMDLPILGHEDFKLLPQWIFLKVVPGANIARLKHEVSQMRVVGQIEENFSRKITSFNARPDATLNLASFPNPIEKPAPPTGWVDDPKRSTNYATYLSGATKIWKKHTIGSPDIIIADIDTGVDYNHPDLAGNMWHNPGEEGLDADGKDRRANGVDDDGNGYVDDYLGWNFVHETNLPWDDHSHGTHTSGIAAAVGGNGWGTSGVCPRCSIMALKFISKEGWGDDLAAVRAIEYAVLNGARILNCSWGGAEFSKVLYDAFKAADDKGVMAVVAAGNEGKDIDHAPFSPANFRLPRQLTVAALYPVTPYITQWSNFGSRKVHVSQAGADITSTVPGGRFAKYSGTSMAAPGVAGSVGLVWSFRPQLTALEVKEYVRKNILGDQSSLSKTLFLGRPNVQKIVETLATSSVESSKH